MNDHMERKHQSKCSELDIVLHFSVGEQFQSGHVKQFWLNGDNEGVEEAC